MTTTYIIPTKAQVEAIIEAHRRSVGSVHVRVSSVMVSLDIAYPGIPSEEFVSLRDTVVLPIVTNLVSEGLAELWG